MAHKWTFMVYMAGDNGKVFDDGGQLMDNLEEFGWMDIASMSEVGSTADVAVVVQYDTLDAGRTPRFYIDGASQTGKVKEIVPPVNTGDPANLTDFVVWAEQNYPAERYALVLWNHGSGWKEDDVYARYRELEAMKERDQVRSLDPGGKLLRRSLFLPTAAQIMGIQDDEVRAICYDDSSLDFLDNQELVRALADAEKVTGQRLALLGMDACLMSMVEVAYQVRHHAEVLVGSQEVEPGEGWPYTSILGQLVVEPSMPARELGELIVEEYGAHYLSTSRDGGGIITQSAIDLGRMEDLGQQVGGLARELMATYDQDIYVEIAVRRAKDEVQRFEDPDYVDLVHFAEQVWRQCPPGLEAANLAQDLANNLEPYADDSPILANVRGALRPKAHGLSIYFPWKGCSSYYDNLDFAALGWRDWLYQVNKVSRA